MLLKYTQCKYTINGKFVNDLFLHKIIIINTNFESRVGNHGLSEQMRINHACNITCNCYKIRHKTSYKMSLFVNDALYKYCMPK